MTCTWFHIDCGIGGHECILITISKDEIYFIDYYIETERKKLFRIIKFKTLDKAYTLIKEALYQNNNEAFDRLFDFQPNADKNKDEITTNCHILKINELPTFNKLWKIWIDSYPILKELHDEEIQEAKDHRKAKDPSRKFMNEYYNTFLKQVQTYNFEKEFEQEMDKFNIIYNELSIEIEYYDIL